MKEMDAEKDEDISQYLKPPEKKDKPGTNIFHACYTKVHLEVLQLLVEAKRNRLCIVDKVSSSPLFFLPKNTLITPVCLKCM